MDLITIKSSAINRCRLLLLERIQSFEAQVRELSSGAQNESKSSAGDKHETARAMAQLEQEKLAKQLHETQVLLQELTRIPFHNTGETIVPGSLVSTTNGLIFLAVALGKIEAEAHSIMVISLRSPLAKLLLARRKMESLTFNSVTYSIIDFC